MIEKRTLLVLALILVFSNIFWVKKLKETENKCIKIITIQESYIKEIECINVEYRILLNEVIQYLKEKNKQ